jgi:hypothetical protein
MSWQRVLFDGIASMHQKLYTKDVLVEEILGKS